MNSNSNDSYERSPTAPADSLPPVSPPSAGLILQLFLVPGIIVAAIFLVVGLFGMLADSGSDPRQQVRDLLHPNEQRRWRAAHALANILAADRQAVLGVNRKHTTDPALAASVAEMLGQILDRQSAVGGSDSEEDTLLRAYLATALGMFDDPAGVPMLLKATAAAQPIEVRVRAIEALTLLASRSDIKSADVNAVLDGLASDPEPVIRKMCAYAMGVVGDTHFVGTPPSQPGRLVLLLADAESDVACNAAAALARMGRAEGLAVLARMLESEAGSPEVAQEEPEQREFKSATLVLAALESIKSLAKANTVADLNALAESIDKLSRSPHARIRASAAEVKLLLKE